MTKIFCSLVLSIMLFSSNARAAEYWISPVLAFWPGFGVGHFVEGRVERGVTFLALDAAALGGTIYFFTRPLTANSNGELVRDWQWATVFGMAALGIRI